MTDPRGFNLPTSQASALRSSNQVREALDFSRHPECPSLGMYARFNQPRDLPPPEWRYGIHSAPNEYPMTNVVQPERSSTAAELFEQTAHEDKIYFSHGFPLEKSRVIRKPEELNPVIFDENHVFGGVEEKGLSAADTLKPVHRAPPLQTSSDPRRFLRSTGLSQQLDDTYRPSSTSQSTRSMNDLAETVAQDNKRFYNHYTNIGPLQKQDPKRTALESTIDRGYSNSFNPNERFGIRNEKQFTDTTEACVRSINGARDSLPYAHEYRSIHRMPQTTRAINNDLPAGTSSFGPSSDVVCGAPSDKTELSVKEVVQSCGFDDRGCLDATTLTNTQKMRKSRYGYEIPRHATFGCINSMDSHSTKPACIGGDADGTEWGVINHLDLYAPKR
ncbi:hypothetical protein GL50803_0014507 [Giardia duodenalis]|uniref:Uncharacterized protein n=1 Tax=Giardia intestinalis (strain ATCC 50803 / WB clone C6) TaxID=184922 RepID=A8BA55_GIAIC|nr:hypothetical protein GL50803_0014507 [Giardia intestinalis]KAE8303573.1 hypothetical protein GL50803_0014507 [Giardia intestinalis]|eukprot:XP_001708308.1 Hypothetical protein GL50803_14507 [Giardia lamblia ATCC 50803]